MKTSIIAALLIALVTRVSVAQDYKLDRLCIGSGGINEQYSENYGAMLTIAQSAAGYSESSGYGAYLGFWPAVAAQSVNPCGDANSSGYVDIDDIIFIVNYVFTGGPSPDPYQTADTNCSGFVDIDDIIFLVNYVFTAGPEPCDANGDGVPDC